jgi:hypothetical protein
MMIHQYKLQHLLNENVNIILNDLRNNIQLQVILYYKFINIYNQIYSLVTNSTSPTSVILDDDDDEDDDQPQIETSNQENNER